MPDARLTPASHAATRRTCPRMSTGTAAPGSWITSLTTVPTGSGLRVLMNRPSRLMFVAQSLRKRPTLRYVTASSCWSRCERRALWVTACAMTTQLYQGCTGAPNCDTLSTDRQNDRHAPGESVCTSGISLANRDLDPPGAADDGHQLAGAPVTKGHDKTGGQAGDVDRHVMWGGAQVNGADRRDDVAEGIAHQALTVYPVALAPRLRPSDPDRIVD